MRATPGRPHTPSFSEYGAAKAAAETAVRLLVEDSVVARTSLVIGDGRSEHERTVHDLASGARRGVLFTDDVHCPVHRSDLAAALWELACSSVTGVCHLAGEHAVTRYELGTLIARRDGLDPSLLPAGRRSDDGPPGPLCVLLDSRKTQKYLDTRLQGAREFLCAQPRPVADADEVPAGEDPPPLAQRLTARAARLRGLAAGHHHTRLIPEEPAP